MRPDWDRYREIVRERTMRGSDTDCWPWTGPLHIAGYGKQANNLAHRVTFYLHFGWLPDAPYVIDHICQNRLCQNLGHMQVITRSENTRLGTTRNGRHRGTHCRNGHEWNDDNTYVRKSGDFVCRACRREQMRARSA